ncbi:MAG: hypothetical protein M3Y59_15015 [Myxococcota bacterium]|nr:hypothetical protein [Myxococcota bacterium]
MKRFAWTAVGVSLVTGTLGCAAAEQTVRAGDGPAVLADSAMVMSFSERGLRSDKLEIQRASSGILGTASGQPMAMSWEGGVVRGTYRHLPVELNVSSEQDTTTAMGQLDGQGAALRISPSLVEGYVSQCAFRMERGQDGAFVGARSCGAEDPEPMVMALPARLWERERTEQAAWVALLLSEYGNEGAKLRSVARPSVVMSTDRSPRVLRKSGLRGQN